MGRQFLQDLWKTTRNRTYTEIKMMISMLLLFCLSAPSISHKMMEDAADNIWMFVPGQVVTLPGQCINKDGKPAKEWVKQESIAKGASIEKPENPFECLKCCYKIILYADVGPKGSGCSWNIETKKCTLYWDNKYGV